MQLVDRIEKRRFVGRELLLWLWFESEIFEGTLSTKEHGSFGLWIEGALVLTNGKEATRIKGSTPAAAREAKESLAIGKLPESAGFHLVRDAAECSFSLKAEHLQISGLKLPTVLGAEEEQPEQLRKGPRKRKSESREREEIRESDEAHEAFYERMHLTREFEALVEALYRDFLTLRLSDAWGFVTKAMRAWVAGEDVDADAYREARERALGGSGKKRKSA